jgi:polyisoprenoid-binding protein YceI
MFPNQREGGYSMKRNLWFALGIFLLFAPVLVYGAHWQVDPDHSSFQFKVRHMTVSSVRGDFGKLIQGIVYFDPQDVTSTKAQVVLDAASVSTNHAKRDEHLRGPDFFDVSKYPTITFVSKQVTKVGPDTLRATGDLTLHGVTREVVLDIQGPAPEVKDPSGNFRRGLTATGRINRKDFGMTWNRALDTGGMVIGEEVEISVEIEMTRR